MKFLSGSSKSLSTISSVLISLFILGLLFVPAAAEAAPTNETITWSEAADWSAAADEANVEIDGNSLKWQLSEILTFQENTEADWGDSYSLQHLVFDDGILKVYEGGIIPFIGETYNFTNAGNTGRLGPSQANVDNAYSGTNLAGDVTVVDGIQHWEVPATGTYRITAYGAQGGTRLNSQGRGAKMSGEFELEEGDELQILVGQQGIYSMPGGRFRAGGGGGSFVVNEADNPLVVAGGGGGAYNDNDITHGTTSQDANDGSGTTTSGSGGIGGEGGNAANSYGYGGGGFTGNSNNATRGGLAFLNGGAGGSYSSDGGFGGGGAAREEQHSWYQWPSWNYRRQSGAGGGGGYSGGGGGHHNRTATNWQNAFSAWGGGGGSYNDGENQDNQGGYNSGHGRVEIEVPDANFERISRPLNLTEIYDVFESTISWDYPSIDQTEVKIKTAVTNDGNNPPADPSGWTEATNGDSIPEIVPGDDLTEKYLWVRQLLETDDVFVANPELNSLAVEIVGNKSTTGHLLTAPESMMAGKPELVGLEYDLNGQVIELDIIGSPGTPAEETISAVELTGQTEQVLPWSASHSEFQIQVNMESLDGTTAPELHSMTLLRPAEFSVEIQDDESLYRGVEGYELYVTAEITNINEVTYSQDIMFKVDSTVVDSQVLNLVGGHSNTVQFTYTPAVEEGLVEAAISSNNETETRMLGVIEDPAFSVEIEDEATDLEVVEGQPFNLRASIRNYESVDYGLPIEFYFDGEFVASQNLELIAGETVPVEFVYEECAAGQDGAEMWVGRDDIYDTRQLRVFALPYFEVEMVEVVNSVDGADTINQGEIALVRSWIFNRGCLEGTQQIEFSVDGQLIEDQELTLSGQTGETVEFLYSVEREDDGREAGVSTDNDSYSVKLRVLWYPEFVVTIDHAASALQVAKGYVAEIVVGLENLGDYEATREIVFEVDGTNIGSQHKNLGPKASGTLVFDYSTELERDDGAEVKLTSLEPQFADNSDTALLTVLNLAGGWGTPADPYRIESWKQLDELHRDKSANFQLTVDLDDTVLGYEDIAGQAADGGRGWHPVGHQAEPFYGVFDGSGKRIEGLHINRPEASDVGLFGAVGDGANLHDIEMIDLVVTGGENVGGVAGLISAAEGRRISVSGAVSGDGNYIGGVVGQSDEADLSMLEADVKVSGEGLHVGAVAGRNTGLLTNSLARGEAAGFYRVGGLVGQNQGGQIHNVYADVAVEATGFQAGGLVGYNAGEIDRSYSRGPVQAQGMTGGLVGNSWQGVVTNSFWDEENSGQFSSAGGDPLIPAQMRFFRIYQEAGWDIERTEIVHNEAYPFLSWELGTNSPVWYITSEDHHSWAARADLEEPVEQLYSYPNPYVAGVSPGVIFDVPARYGGSINLEIYNIAGRRLLSKRLDVNQDNQVTWQPDLASGTYIYLITGSGHSSSSTLTIIR